MGRIRAYHVRDEKGGIVVLAKECYRMLWYGCFGGDGVVEAGDDVRKLRRAIPRLWPQAATSGRRLLQASVAQAPGSASQDHF